MRTLLALLVLGASSLSLAGVTVYTDRAAFLAAAGSGLRTEEFSTAAAFTPGNNFYGGLNFYIGPTAGGSVSGGKYNGREDNINLHTPTNLSLDFSAFPPITAWGADFDSAYSTYGVVLNTPTERIDLSQYLPAPADGFLGFITTTPFIYMNFGSTGFETYGMDNMTYGVAAPVPEPATCAALAVGIAALARRRRTVRRNA